MSGSKKSFSMKHRRAIASLHTRLVTKRLSRDIAFFGSRVDKSSVNSSEDFFLDIYIVGFGNISR
jgi:hypothetical protein